MLTFKRCISLLLALVMVISMLPAQAVATGYQTVMDNTAVLADALEAILSQPVDISTETTFVPEETWPMVMPEALPELEPAIILTETEGDYTYTVSSDTNTAIITGYTGSDSAMVIPDTLGGYPVTGIGDEAFKNKTVLLNVVVADGVTTIGSRAFENCSSIAS